MVTQHHESFLAILHDRAEIVPQLAKEGLGINIESHARVRPASEAMTERFPAELNCDGVQICEDENGTPVHAFITEVQRKPDPDKYYSWPAYQTHLFHRMKCPATLISFCTNRVTAKWASNMRSRTGQRNIIFQPWVLGPDELPLLTQHDGRANYLERSVMAMLVNSEEKVIDHAVESYIHDVAKLTNDDIQRYTIYALSCLDEGARSLVEILMEDRRIFPYGSPLLERTQKESEARGEASALLKVMESRGIGLTEELRERVRTCTDVDQLDTWLVRASTASTVDEVFKN